MGSLENLRDVERIIWAHRGRSLTAPENTLMAFRQSLRAGDTGIEFDVTLSGDCKPVIIHDYTLERTTRGRGGVSHHTYEQLREMDAGSWFDPRFSGEKLPSLHDVLEELCGRVYLNIEIKPSTWRGKLPKEEEMEGKLMDSIGGFGIEDSVLISSFDWRSLLRVRSLNQNIAIGVLAKRGWNPHIVASFTRKIAAFSIHPNLADLVNGMPIPYRQFQGKVFPYTVSDESTATRLLRIGADGFFADLPLRNDLAN